MKHLTAAAVTLAAIALTATACSSSTKSGTAAPATSPAPASSAPAADSPSPSTAPSQPWGSGSGAGSGAASGTTVALTHTALGTFLVDAKGRTLYLFEKDTSPMSHCTGPCASAWPPDTTSGAPHAGAGLNAALLGTTTRPDHTTQVTYNGHPLYTFAGDNKPGDTNGEGSKAFGAGWYVVAPNGSKIDNS